MEPDQPNACGRFAALALADGARPAERLRPLLLPEQPNACGNGGFCCRRRWICRRCCCCPNSRTPAATVDFAVGDGGFCRRCCCCCCPNSRTPAATVDFAVAAAAVAARTAERLRQRWILPSSGGWHPAAAADRRQPQKKRRWGNLCLLPHTHPLACGGLPPPRKLLRWMASSRCRR